MLHTFVLVRTFYIVGRPDYSNVSTSIEHFLDLIFAVDSFVVCIILYQSKVFVAKQRLSPFY